MDRQRLRLFNGLHEKRFSFCVGMAFLNIGEDVSREKFSFPQITRGPVADGIPSTAQFCKKPTEYFFIDAVSLKMAPSMFVSSRFVFCRNAKDKSLFDRSKFLYSSQ